MFFLIVCARVRKILFSISKFIAVTMPLLTAWSVSGFGRLNYRGVGNNGVALKIEHGEVHAFTI